MTKARPLLPSPRELVIVKPGSPETAGTRYLGLLEALDRHRGAVLRGKAPRRDRSMPPAQREAALVSASCRALFAAAAYGFEWRPRLLRCPKSDTLPMAVDKVVDKKAERPVIRPRLNFAK